MPSARRSATKAAISTICNDCGIGPVRRGHERPSGRIPAPRACQIASRCRCDGSAMRRRSGSARVDRALRTCPIRPATAAARLPAIRARDRGALVALARDPHLHELVIGSARIERSDHAWRERRPRRSAPRDRAHARGGAGGGDHCRAVSSIAARKANPAARRLAGRRKGGPLPACRCAGAGLYGAIVSGKGCGPVCSIVRSHQVAAKRGKSALAESTAPARPVIQ
jgi:hypothetical protein